MIDIRIAHVRPVTSGDFPARGVNIITPYLTAEMQSVK